jgi:predicted ATPase
VAFNGDALLELAAEFLALARRQGATLPLMVGHRLMATSLMGTGDIATSLTHYDRAIALYDSAEHRSLATRFGQDIGVVVLCFRAWSRWLLGYPEAALVDAEHAVKDARGIGQAATMMYALFAAARTPLLCGNYAAANALTDELIALADDKGTLFWKASGLIFRGCILALTDQSSDAIYWLTSGLTAWQSTGAVLWRHDYLSYLARAYVELGHFDDAWRCIGEAETEIRATKATLFEAEINRIAGEIALKSPERDTAKAEAYFERALTVARKQQAKSWELRAATSMARLWRDQGKRDEARELLAPVYGWFTEGFDTREAECDVV